MPSRLFPLLVPFLVAAASLDAADVEGRVTLPPPQVAPVPSQHYEVINSAGVLAMNPPLAVVYLEGGFPRPSTPATVKVTQKDLMFVPALLPIQAGTRVEFPNLDDLYHNIFSFSPTKRFDLGRYRPEDHPIPSQVFETPGLVTLRCEIHEHMRGLILILDTPHFVLTDQEGRFRLTNLPAGKYTLKAWIDSKTTQARSIELTADSRLQVDFP